MRRKFTLRIVEGQRSGEAWVIEEGGSSITVGRATDVVASVPDQLLSRHHCEFAFEGIGVIVRDLGSRNGTFVNGQKIDECVLLPGDIVHAGGLVLEILGEGEGIAATATSIEALSCSQCEAPIEPGSIDRGETIEIGGAWYCAPCARKLQEPAHGPIPGYTVLEKIGEGGMGSVYKARQDAFNRVVAVKTIRRECTQDAKMVQRFIREAKTGAAVQHPNVVAFYDAGDVNGLYYIVLEFVDGEGLAKRIKRERRLAPAEALGIARQVACGLDAAFAKGIVHRDIKPDNVLIEGATGTAKISDFGLAKNFQDTGLSRLTARGVGMGTPHYMPPEQLRDAATCDHRADIYALGATLYHMLAGEPPFAGLARQQLFKALVKDSPTPIRTHCPSISADVTTVVEKAMARDVAERFQKPSDLIRAIDAAANRALS